MKRTCRLFSKMVLALNWNQFRGNNMYTAMLFLTYIITFSISFERISLKILFIWAIWVLPKQIFLFSNIKKRWIISGVIFIFMYIKIISMHASNIFSETYSHEGRLLNLEYPPMVQFFKLIFDSFDMQLTHLVYELTSFYES